MNDVVQSQPNRRLGYMAAAFCGLFAALAGRLVYIQGLQPDTPRYTLGGTPPRVAYSPALRGEILDARAQRIVHSQHVYNVRANPVVIGDHADTLARHLAPVLGTPAERLADAFRIRPEPRWKPELRTNAAGLASTNWVQVLYTNQSVLVATNLSLDRWTAVKTNLAAYATAEELRLRAAWQAVEDRRKHPPTFAWWDLPSKYRHRRALALERRDVARLLRPTRLSNEVVRKTALAPELLENRVYPHERLAATLLGSTTNGPVPVVEYRTAAGTIHIPARELPPLLQGASGIERQFDDELRGVPGKSIARNRGAREIANTRELEVAPRPGANVRLTLDANLQYVAEEALRRGMERLRPNWMSAVLVRPQTGEILALANATSPTYLPPGVTNAALFRSQPPRNHAVSELVEPGSTFKLVTYAAALEAGKLTPDSRIDCQGGVWMPPSGRRKTVNDARGHKLGNASIEEAFALSSNVGAAKIGYFELWDPRSGPKDTPLCRMANAFGFNRRTGILCGGEPVTRIPAWDGMGTQIILSYGYGIYATPLQVCMAYSAVANGGVLMEPMIVKSVEDAEGNVIRTIPPRAVGRAVKPETARQLVRLMTAVVSPKGTGKDAVMADYTVAGKTGTANKMTKAHMASGATAHFSTFVGFFPAEKPEICILVCADEPTGTDGRAAYGAATIPTFNQIAREAASYLTIPPSPSLALDPAGRH